MFGKSCLTLVILGLYASYSFAQSFVSYFGDDSREVNIRDLIGRPVAVGSSTTNRGGSQSGFGGVSSSEVGGGSPSGFGGGSPSGTGGGFPSGTGGGSPSGGSVGPFSGIGGVSPSGLGGSPSIIGGSSSSGAGGSFPSQIPEGPRPGRPSLGPCDDVCTKILEPLCGVDGRNYNNRCILKNASCRSQLSGRPPIEIAHQGFCNTP